MFTKEIQLTSGLGVATANMNVSQYPDGTPMVQKPDLAATGDTLILRPKSFDSFFTGLFLADALEERGQRVKNLVLPFVPGARQDRLNSVGDFLFTAKSVARAINERKFDRVVLLDPHSNVITGLIDRSLVYPFTGVLNYFKSDYDGIIAPDAGAGARTREFADALTHFSRKKFEVIQAHKHRDVETGKLSGFEVSVEKGKHYLVVDDICDGGGTFVGLGQAIAKQGATADLFVTHGIFSKGTAKLNELYGHIYTTDSTLFDKHDAEEITITDRIVKWMH